MQAGFGRGFGFWAAALSLQTQRLRELLDAWDAVEELPYTVGSGEWLSNWHLKAQADAHYLVLGVRHVIRHAFKFRDLIGTVDPRPAAALAAFADRIGTGTETIRDLRDMLEHWDEWSFTDKPYQGKMLVRPPGLIADQLQVMPRDSDLWVGLGGMDLPLIEVAAAAIALADELGQSLREAISPPGIAPGGFVTPVGP